MSNEIIILVGGRKFTGWKSIRISQSLETLSSQFSLIVVDEKLQENNADWFLRPQDECILFIGDDRLITGYIDDVTNNITKDSHMIKVTGRDKTSDLIDCNYIESENSWNKINLFDLAKKLCAPFNISVINNGIDLSETIPKFTINKSDTVFDNLNKKAKDFGVLIITNNLGELVLTNSGNDKANDTLEYGTNILKGDVSHTYIERFSRYIMESQVSNSGGWKTNTISIKTESTDEGVKRKCRTKLIKSSRPLSRTISQKTVQWESSYRAARSQSFNVTVQGFRQSNGDIWKVNKLVDVFAPPLYINPITQLLITSVTFVLNDDGSFTSLTLKRKDAYEAKPVIPESIKPSKSLGWGKLPVQNSGGWVKDVLKDVGEKAKELIKTL